MMIAVEVTVVPDGREPTTTSTEKLRIHPDTLKRFAEGGEYPMTLQIFIEAAVPRLIRDTIKEALEVPTRDNRN